MKENIFYVMLIIIIKLDVIKGGKMEMRVNEGSEEEEENLRIFFSLMDFWVKF